MQKQIQFIGTTPTVLADLISETLKLQLEEIKKHLQPKKPAQFITRQYVAKEMLHCDLSTVHNLTKKGVLIKYQCGGRVLYKRSEVEDAIVKLNN